MTVIGYNDKRFMLLTEHSHISTTGVFESSICRGIRLCADQRDRSLKDHTTDFVFLANYTHYPDNCLCSFYHAGLNAATQAQLSRDAFTIFIENDNTTPTLDPEPSSPSSHCTEQKPEPTADREPMVATINEASPRRVTELEIAPLPEPHGLSDQVCEPATALCTIPEGDLSSMDYVLPVPPSLSSSLNCLSSLSHHLCTSPHYHLHCLFPGNSSSPPQPTICAVGLPRVCQSPLALWLEDSLSPPTDHRPSGSTMSPSSLLSAVVCQFTISAGLPCPPGSTPVSRPPSATSGLHSSGYASSLQLCQASLSLQLLLLPLSLQLHRGLPETLPLPPALLLSVSPLELSVLPPWLLPLSTPLWVAFMAVAWGPPDPSCSSLHLIHLGSSFFSMAPPFIHHLGTLHLSPSALSGSSLPPSPPQSSLSRSPPLPRSPEPSAKPWPSGFLVSPWLFGSPSPPWRLLHSHLPSVSPLELSALHLPWLLPLSAFMATAWVPPGPSCSKSLLSTPWLLPPSDPPPSDPPFFFLHGSSLHTPPRHSTSPATPHPSGSVRLLSPSGSFSVLCHSSFIVAFLIPASVTGAICSALALWILVVTLALRLSVSHLETFPLPTALMPTVSPL
ncbi:Mitochondrial intermediate peptidase [Labeo rohita]|uniref:Mitochondrial intermediate peptidase n=1 Tax=Labeo rohita TaxID=84645 RepID=A0ABQ8LFC2_LABRO|nr:Mitochondrial intermediate peptidase [Labeo rohita]